MHTSSEHEIAAQPDECLLAHRYQSTIPRKQVPELSKGQHGEHEDQIIENASPNEHGESNEQNQDTDGGRGEAARGPRRNLDPEALFALRSTAVTSGARANRSASRCRTGDCQVLCSPAPCSIDKPGRFFHALPHAVRNRSDAQPCAPARAYVPFERRRGAPCPRKQSLGTQHERG